jgi:hypothetical protein
MGESFQGGGIHRAVQAGLGQHIAQHTPGMSAGYCSNNRHVVQLGYAARQG